MATVKSSGDSKEEKICRKYLTLDLGVIKYEGQEIPLKGSLIFEFLHENRSPNVKVLQKFQEKLKSWLSLYFSGKSLAFFCKLLKFNMIGLSCLTPEWYINEDIHHNKLFWIAIFHLAEWVTDNLDDQKEFTSHPEYPKMSRFIPVTLYKILTLKFPTLKDLQQEIDQFGFFHQFDTFRDCFSLWFHLVQGLHTDLKMTLDQLTLFAESVERQYDCNCWFDGPGNKQVDNESLQSTLTLFTCGGGTQIKLTAIMEGLYEPEKVHAVREKYLKRLKFVVMMSHSMVNDIVSLRKEVTEESHNNFIFLWSRQGLSLEQSVAKAFERHDEYLKEAEKIYKFIQRTYVNDPAILFYADLIVDSFAGNIQFSIESGRYGPIKCTYDTK